MRFRQPVCFTIEYIVASSCQCILLNPTNRTLISILFILSIRAPLWRYSFSGNISLWEKLVVLKRTDVVLCREVRHALSPQIRLANWISLGIIVTLLAWMAQRLVSSNRPTMYASLSSCKATTAEDCIFHSVLRSCNTSLTNL